ncbi:MAG: hypothetical protein HOC74_40845 [Gemmatimonadetes bacterium]|jgi:hypothetical protein|nr:hypothetical protein [Gemmatimonadota bacterium]
MGISSYQELFQERFKALGQERRDLQAWQCRLELKGLYPGLFQAVFGRDNREKFMGAVDFHLTEGYTLEEAYELVGQYAPELAEELSVGSLEEI